MPQESVLGPFLFCIYTCNLLSCVKYGTSNVYDDDTQVRFSFLFSSIDFANNMINEELRQLQQTSLQRELSLNGLTSSVLVFGKNKELAEVLLKILNSSIL